MFSRLLTALALAVIAVLPAFPQSTNVTVTRDLRLFTAMAALNAAGFDVELGPQYHPVREAVRKYAAEVDDPDLIERLKAFYSTKKGSQSDESQLPKYISLAVSLTDAPGLRLLTHEENMPPDARSVVGFADLMREYYEKAHLGRHALEVRADYDKTIAQLAPVLRELIVRTDSYMRIPLGGNAGPGMAIYLELAAPMNTVNVRSNQNNYYVIIGDSMVPRTDDIRHAYLHFQIDTLVSSNMSRIPSAGQILDLVKYGQGVDPVYTSDAHVMVAESLIRALELRMDKVPSARAKESVDTFYRTGLLLTPFFYSALDGYERGDVNLRDSFVQMTRNIQLKTEEARFRDTFSKIPLPQKSVARAEVPQAPPAPEPNPVGDLLKEAQTAFNSGDMVKARNVFDRVLADFDRNNGPAEYGLGLIASRVGFSEEAKQHFDRAIHADALEPGMKVWSYIYLGRIFDLECNRERAVEYYQQAVKVGDNSRDAQAVATEGVQKAYGDNCSK
jgi:hypothetical protein